MALLKMTSSKASPKKGIDYITDQEKASIVNVQNLFPGLDYATQFYTEALQNGRSTGVDDRKYYHFVFSPDQSDQVDAKTCQAAAEQFAEEFFKNYQCVIATHEDTDTVHSHIIVNAVSFVDHKKLDIRNQFYDNMKNRADEIGLEWGMSALGDRRNRQNPERYASAEVQMAKRGQISWKDEIRMAIEDSQAIAHDWTDFVRILGTEHNIQIRLRGNTLSYCHPERTQFVRANKLGDRYTREEIEHGLEQTFAEFARLESEIEAAGSSANNQRLEERDLFERQGDFLERQRNQAFEEQEERRLREFQSTPEQSGRNDKSGARGERQRDRESEERSFDPEFGIQHVLDGIKRKNRATSKGTRQRPTIDRGRER